MLQIVKKPIRILQNFRLQRASLTTTPFPKFSLKGGGISDKGGISSLNRPDGSDSIDPAQATRDLTDLVGEIA